MVVSPFDMSNNLKRYRTAMKHFINTVNALFLPSPLSLKKFKKQKKKKKKKTFYHFSENCFF